MPVETKPELISEEISATTSISRPVPLWFKLALLGCVVVFTLFFLAFAASVSTGFQG